MSPYESISPITGEIIASFPSSTEPSFNSLLNASKLAGGTLASLSLEKRATLFLRLAELLRSRANEFAHIMAVEMGKPLAQGRAESIKCAWVCEHYAAFAEEMLRPEVVAIGSQVATIDYQPLGVILAIMPWNFPFWQVFRCAAPIMMAGNTVLLKHAPNVPQCAQAIEDLFIEAGFPSGSLSSVFAELDDIPQLVGDRRVAGVTLTGSTRAGRSVAALAGHHLKPTVLELGGSDPYIILDDADLKLALDRCVTSRLLNSGQSCIAAKRFLIHKDIAQAFESALVKALSEKTVGDPVNEQTDVGPLARIDLADTLRTQVASSIAAGAKRLYSSSSPDGGCFVPIEVLKDVKPNMPAWDEELFGPVFALRTFSTDDDAISMANDTVYGLGAAVFSCSTVRAESIANRLNCGNVAINDFVKSDPRYPFGGIKESGYGRELSHNGIKAFANVKTTIK